MRRVRTYVLHFARAAGEILCARVKRLDATERRD